MPGSRLPLENIQLLVGLELSSDMCMDMCRQRGKSDGSLRHNFMKLLQKAPVNVGVIYPFEVRVIVSLTQLSICNRCCESFSIWKLAAAKICMLATGRLPMLERLGNAGSAGFTTANC